MLSGTPLMLNGNNGWSANFTVRRAASVMSCSPSPPLEHRELPENYAPRRGSSKAIGIPTAMRVTGLHRPAVTLFSHFI
jgi:hypothetical protein